MNERNGMAHDTPLTVELMVKPTESTNGFNFEDYQILARVDMDLGRVVDSVEAIGGHVYAIIESGDGYRLARIGIWSDYAETGGRPRRCFVVREWTGIAWEPLPIVYTELASIIHSEQDDDAVTVVLNRPIR